MLDKTNDASIAAENWLTQFETALAGNDSGALKALLMVNEHLEAEIAQLYAAAAHYGFADRGSSVLH